MIQQQFTVTICFASHVEFLWKSLSLQKDTQIQPSLNHYNLLHRQTFCCGDKYIYFFTKILHATRSESWQELIPTLIIFPNFYDLILKTVGLARTALEAS